MVFSRPFPRLALGLGLVLAVFAVLSVRQGVPAYAQAPGANAVGTAAFAVPRGAVFVSPTGSDSGAGNQGSPYRTLERAVSATPAGGTIVMRGGTYHTANLAIYNRVTIQNYPDEAVWLDASVPVTGWTRDGATWRHDGWTTRFDHSPTYTKGAPDGPAPYWQFVNPTDAPMAAHPDQFWINGTPMWQVKSLSAVAANTFYLDEATSRLYLGSDPNGRTVTASNIQQALLIRASGTVVQGIGIRNYAPSVWQMGAVVIQQTNVTLRQVTIAQSATTGISVQSSGATLDGVTITDSGMLGLHGHYADELRIDNSLIARNNTQRFNMVPVAGGVRLSKVRGVAVRGSDISDNRGSGFWPDESCYDITVVNSKFRNNARHGVHIEISAKAVVANNIVSGNAADGIRIQNTNKTKIWNNTIFGNGRPINLVQDTRKNTNPNDGAVDKRIPWPDPEMPWQLRSVIVSNNVIAAPTSAANCELCVEDWTNSVTAEQMGVSVDGGIYSRASTSAPSWLVVWSKGPANPGVYISLSAFKAATGQEAHGREFIGQSVVDGSGALSATVQAQASSIARPMPADVAALIGWPTGTQRLGAVATATPPTNPPPTPSTPGSVVAQDDFNRASSNGWGTANVGGAWSPTALTSSFSVDSGTSRISLRAGQGVGVYLGAVNATSTDTRINTVLGSTITGDGHYVSLIGRSTSAGDYRLKVRVVPGGAVTGWLVRRTGATETVVGTKTLPAGSYPTNGTLSLRLQVQGTNPTTVRGKVWMATANQPADWQMSATDSTSSLQSGGSIGLYGYASSAMTNGPLTLYFGQLKSTS